MAIWPSSAATSADLFTAVNALATTLSSGINNSVTTIPLTSTTGFPTAGAVVIDQEVIFYTGVSGSNLTGAIRGSDGTSAAAHSGGVPVSASIVAFHHNGLMQEIVAMESWLQTNVVANPLTANLAAGGFKITGLAAGTTNGDALRYEQVIGQFLLLSGGTLTGQLSLASGTVGSPSLTFSADSGLDTGLFWNSENNFSLVTAGAIKLQIGGTAVYPVVPLQAADGTVSTPSISFASDANTGIYWTTDGQINFSTNGVLRATLAPAGLTISSADLFVRSIQNTGGVDIQGTNTNDAASSGYMGEYIASTPSPLTLSTTDVWENWTSISLTAGDWDVSFLGSFAAGTANTGYAIGISTDSTPSSFSDANNSNYAYSRTPSGAYPKCCIIPVHRISLSSTTTIYAKVQASWSATQPNVRGRISARRVR